MFCVRIQKQKKLDSLHKAAACLVYPFIGQSIRVTLGWGKIGPQIQYQERNNI